MNTIARLRMLAVALFVTAITVPVLGQDAPAPPPPGGPDQNADQRGDGGRNRGGGGNRWDPAEMRQRMRERMKEMLGASDEELQVLEPKIEHVMQLQRDAGGFGRGMFGGMRGRGGPGGPGGDRADRPDRGPNPDQPQSPVQTKLRELQTVLDNKDASPDEIKAKLVELRDARTKAKEALTKAQTELRELLTQRQEAVMVMMGMLD